MRTGQGAKVGSRSSTGRTPLASGDSAIAGRDLVVDAVATGYAPGTVIRLEGDQVPAFFRQKISPHQLGLSNVLAAPKNLNSEPAALIENCP